MRIITKNGRVMEVNKTYPFAEASTTINKEQKYLYERAKRPEYATGIIFTYEDPSNNFGFNNVQDFIIGNLSPAKVLEIERTLVRKGYFDFTDMDFQKVKSFENTKLDGGKGLPYCSDYTFLDICAMNSVKNIFGGSNDIFGSAAIVDDDSDSFDDFGDDCEEDFGDE